jgi:hypothetical protein
LWAISLAKGRVDWTVSFDQDTLDGASMALLIYPELTWEEECKMALLHMHSVVPPSMCKQAGDLLEETGEVEMPMSA